MRHDGASEWNWFHGILPPSLSLLVFVSSDVYCTKGRHFWIKASRGWRCSYAEQHARLRLHLSPPDVLAGLCWCEVRQQTGVHLPGLCHCLHRLHIHRSACLCLQTSSFPVSKGFWIFRNWALAIDVFFFVFLVFFDQIALLFAACAYWEIGPSVAMNWTTACVWRRSTCRWQNLKTELTPTSPLSWVKNYVYLKPAFDEIQWIRWIRIKLVSLKAKSKTIL